MKWNKIKEIYVYTSDKAFVHSFMYYHGNEYMMSDRVSCCDF